MRISIPLFLLALLAAAGHDAAAQTTEFELLIRNARIVDGTGNPWFYGDVGVREGRIAAVGGLADAAAARTIDAAGLVVAPGFIDLHTHTNLVGAPLAESKVRQGVTLDVMGERDSVAPRDGLEDETDDDVLHDWTTFTEYFDLIEAQGISINIISHVSEGQVRRVVMDYDDRDATPEELDRMKALVRRSLEEGAWGLVTRFESGGTTHPDEVLAMARIAGDAGSVYFSHIGSEGYEQQDELDFAVRVAEDVGLPVHILHLKIRGQDLWHEMPAYVNQIQAARDRGLDITANQYPYTAMSHQWSSCFPLWMREGGPDAFAERLQDASLRDRIKADPEFIAWSKEHGWWEGIAMARSSRPENKQYEGMTLAAIAARRRDADPADTFIDLMASEEGRISGVFHNQSEENVRLIMQKPWVTVASDGSAIDLDEPGVPHPRNFGTNVRVLGRYVRDEGVLTLEDAVRKMTSLPAQILGLRDRGQVREGFAADLVVFDPRTVRDTNTYEVPKSYAAGVPYVVVNGVLVIDGGEHTGARPGRVLYGPAHESP